MRILFVVHQFFPEYVGGTETVSYQLAKAAQRAGHFVRVITCRVLQWPVDANTSVIDSVYDGVPVTAFHRLILPHNADIDFVTNPELVKKVRHLLVEEQFDVAHIMHTMRMGAVLEAIFATGLPYVMTLTDFFSQCFRINLVDLNETVCRGASAGYVCAESCLVPPWTKESLQERSAGYRRLLAGADELVCPSEYVMEHYQREYPDLKFRIIEHGIDLVAAVQQEKEGDKLAETGTSMILRIGFVGSFVPEKGVECLIEAFKSVSATNVELRLHGFFGIDAYQQKISALIKEDIRISLRPFIQREYLFSTLAGFDVLCLPSVVPETFSLILREAAAAGTPALVSDRGAPARYVSDHDCGRVVAAGDMDAWAEAIEDLCGSVEMLDHWRANLPVPYRMEEEAFFYQSLYRRIVRGELRQ